mgnify:CR=1 FL=1
MLPSDQSPDLPLGLGEVGPALAAPLSQGFTLDVFHRPLNEFIPLLRFHLVHRIHELPEPLGQRAVEVRHALGLGHALDHLAHARVGPQGPSLVVRQAIDPLGKLGHECLPIVHRQVLQRMVRDELLDLLRRRLLRAETRHRQHRGHPDHADHANAHTYRFSLAHVDPLTGNPLLGRRLRRLVRTQARHG